MTQINYKHPVGGLTPPLVTGGEPSALTIEENLYFPNAAAAVRESLEAVNGHLDEDNLETDTRFDRSHIQKGELTGSGSVGSTANLDFFDTSFYWNQLRTETWPLDEPVDPGVPTDAKLAPKHIAIPGACCTFYIPESATDFSSVLLSWNIGWFNDGCFMLESKYVSNVSRIQLFWDDVPQQTQKRVCPPSVYVEIPDPVVTDSGLWLSSRDFARTYTGHKLIKEVEPGWHTAALKISCPNARTYNSINWPAGAGGWIPSIANQPTHRVRQTRVRVRSMRYIWFKNVNDVP